MKPTEMRVHLLANVTVLVDTGATHEGDAGTWIDSAIQEVRIVPLGADYTEDAGNAVEPETDDAVRDALNGSWIFEPLAHLPAGIVWEG